MAQFTPAAEAIATLKGQGWNYSQIGKALGVNPSLVRQAITPSPGQKQKPLTKYVGSLRELAGKKPGAKPSALPAKRTTKSGAPAATRKKVEKFATKKGTQQQAARVKKAPATLKKVINNAKGNGRGLRWDIKVKKMKTKSGEKKNAWLSGALPRNWTADTLADRIANPDAGQGDTWKAGDVNGALLALAIEQNEGVTSATGATEFSIFTTD